MTIYGTDQSTLVSAKLLKAAGASYSIARCVTEPGSIDGTFAPNVKNAITEGQIPGGYDFLTAGVGASHAQKFIASAGPYLDAGPFAVMLDVEGTRYHVPAKWPDVLIWATTFHASYPLHPILIYSGWYFWNGLKPPTNAAALLGPCAWWVPWYTTRRQDGSDTMPRGLGFAAAYAAAGGDASFVWSKVAIGLGKPAFWQYQGSYGLVGSNVDLNAFRGSQSDLLALAGQAVQYATLAGPDVNVRTAPKLSSSYLYARSNATSITRLVDGVALGALTLKMKFGGWVEGETWTVGGVSGATWAKVWLGSAYRYVAKPLVRL